MSMSSRVRLVVVMDPIEAIKPAKDSTLAILLAAQARGWQVFYAEQKHLWLRDGVAWGRLAPLQVFDDPGKWFVRGESHDAKLGEFDVILMRKDPPFDTEYIYTTYILDRAEVQGARVYNRQQGDKNRNVVFESLPGYGSRYAIVQRYLPEIVTAGDCRIILVDGEPVPFALQRIPAPEDNRGNLAAGARAESRPLNERDRWLCAQIGPKLRSAGMIFVGLDVIGDYVTEINVTSPTGIRELNKKHGVDIGAMLVDAIQRNLSAA